ncbi:histidine ammonia-lyase [Aciduliprofundum sp. MAR08-339]|uniref:histidine ammonia-lyase n=1 Tax=Aciduliprofundum sp. (strain MAR08-339) TaxID=673860 RepID=UPI0002A4B88B|nr:histidine ammonia-lyase [Aciduliprofundum sp. MAR08-339]
MLEINGENLTVEDVVRVARFGERVKISESSIRKVKRSRDVVERILKEERVVYGINTGLGELVNVRIPKKDLKNLQINLIRSHSSGVGDFLSEEVVRAAMLIRANSLLKGFSGVRLEIIETLISMLNSGVTPLVPKFGSVGASGDLAPLAHVALVMIGEGYAKFQGEIMDGKMAMEKAGIKPVEIQEREGLALLNGTAMMAAHAAIAVYDSYNIMKNALISAAMSFEALKATDGALDERIMRARPHPGQIRIAKILRELLKDSEIVERARAEKVQDAYTLRCTPQVYGAILDTLNHVRDVVEREINSATDNPLIFDEPISGGNFHGEPIALAMDFLAIALTDMGNMIERRIARLVDSKLSNLPPFLIENSGTNSGLMIPQYTAAALCNRNKILSYPASADSIPTSANQEDHVSMGMNSAIKLREIVDNVKYIVAIEYLCANQALHIGGFSAPAIQRAMRALGVEKFEVDTVYSPIIERIKRKIDSEEIVRSVEEKINLSL